jgi:hypothetical protein
MKVEIDQSGKLEQLNTITVLSFANGISRSILLTVPTKRLLIQYVRKSLFSEKDILVVLFSILIFLLICDQPNGISFIIDEEYTGKEKIIEKALTRLLQEKFRNKWSGNLIFKQIGKKSPAHKLCWSIHRNKKLQKYIRKITLEEIVKLIK